MKKTISKDFPDHHFLNFNVGWGIIQECPSTKVLNLFTKFPGFQGKSGPEKPFNGQESLLSAWRLPVGQECLNDKKGGPSFVLAQTVFCFIKKVGWVLY